ncbi:hypothetical protein B0H13DRAFT_1891295 [Mycena leptocephala]|nr:hypothetical protein B0H13DRAFT_1891295 [Mycena leptocephala]
MSQGKIHRRCERGDAPWKWFNTGGETAPDAPDWARQEYEIWYRDPDVKIRNMLTSTASSTLRLKSSSIGKANGAGAISIQGTLRGSSISVRLFNIQDNIIASDPFVRESYKTSTVDFLNSGNEVRQRPSISYIETATLLRISFRHLVDTEARHDNPSYLQMPGRRMGTFAVLLPITPIRFFSLEWFRNLCDLGKRWLLRDFSS